MRKITIVFLSFFLMANTIFSDNFNAVDIMNKVDKNITPDSMKYEGVMNIYRGSRKIEKRFISYGRGKDESFIEFTYPPRDKGTKYLRKDNNLWMYLPGAERTVKISGHMLKQSMMGSDFSYDDQTDNTRFSDVYNCVLTGEVIYNENECFVIDLIVKDGESAPYYRQLVTVDKEKFILYRSVIFGRSGKKIKEMIFSDFVSISNRIYPKYLKVDDLLRSDSYTEVIMENLVLDVNIPDRIFTKRNLERK